MEVSKGRNITKIVSNLWLIIALQLVLLSIHIKLLSKTKFFGIIWFPCCRTIPKLGGVFDAVARVSVVIVNGITTDCCRAWLIWFYLEPEWHGLSWTQAVGDEFICSDVMQTIWSWMHGDSNTFFSFCYQKYQLNPWCPTILTVAWFFKNIF